MLKFEEEQRILDEAAKALAAEGPHTPPSRRGSGNLEQMASPRGGALSLPPSFLLSVHLPRCAQACNDTLTLQQ